MKSRNDSQPSTNMRTLRRRLGNSTRRLSVAGLATLYIVTLLVCFILLIVPVYLLQARLLPAWCWLFSAVLALAPLLWLPLDLERPSDFAAWFLYLSVVAPTCFIAFQVSDVDPAQIVILPVVIVAAFALFEACRRRRPIKLPQFVGTKPLYAFALPLAVLLLAAMLFGLSGFKVSLSFGDVYTRRNEARELMPGGSLTAYAISILGSAGVPLAFGLGVIRRNWILLFTSLLATLSIFSFEGSKSVMFTPLVLLFVMFVSARLKRNGLMWVVGFFAAMNILALAESFAFGSGVISSLLVRRQLIVPAQLTTYYWQFFSHNPHVALSDSVLSSIIPPVYSIPTSRLIGLEYMNNVETNANVNLWGAGFAHFGIVGIAMASIVGAFILRLFDSVSKAGKYTLGCVVCATVGMTWSNTALHTSIITGGGAALFIGLILLPKAGYNVSKGTVSPSPTIGNTSDAWHIPHSMQD